MVMIGGATFVGVTGKSYAEGEPHAIEPPDVRLAILHGWATSPSRPVAVGKPFDPDQHADPLTNYLAALDGRIRKVEAWMKQWPPPAPVVPISRRRR
jgi:hypothetical protein